MQYHGEYVARLTIWEFPLQVFYALSLGAVLVYLTRRYLPAFKNPVYLIDTFCYKPPDRCEQCPMVAEWNGWLASYAKYASNYGLPALKLAAYDFHANNALSPIHFSNVYMENCCAVKHHTIIAS